MKDMTTGSEGKLIFFFSIPFMLSGFFQQLYSMVDSMVVGKNIGDAAMAAVGASQPLLMLVMAVVIGITGALSVIISQSYGAGDVETLRKSVTTAVIFAFIASVIVAVVGVFVSGPILKLLGTTPDIYENAKTYLLISFLSVPLVILYNLVGNILRGVGDSKTPLYAVMIATFINIVLDLLFVIVFKWGVGGVAVATAISQFIASAIEIYYVFKNIPLLRFTRDEFVYDKEIFKKMVKIGAPTAVQQGLMSMGFLAVQSMVYTFGTATMAAYMATNKIDTLTTMSIMNLGMAVSFFTGQNVGAGKMDRVKKGYFKALTIAGIFSAVTAVVVLKYGKYLITMFVKAESVETIEVGTRFIGILCLFYFVFAVFTISSGVLRGAGDAFFVMVVTVSNLIVRIVVAAYMIKTPLGSSGLIWAMPVGWLFGAVCNNLRLLGTKWKQKAIITKGAQTVDEAAF